MHQLALYTLTALHVLSFVEAQSDIMRLFCQSPDMGDCDYKGTIRTFMAKSLGGILVS